MDSQRSFEETPFVTIGALTYNGATRLDLFLDALKGLDYPKSRLRIVFVDNLSIDATPRLLSEYIRRHGKDYEKALLVSMKSNIPTARNLCLQNATGEYVFFLDSDVIPKPETVTLMLEIFRVNPHVAIVGFPYRSRFVAEAQQLIETESQLLRVELFVQCGCTMMKRELFREIGCFNPLFDYYEDWELSVRAFRAGYLALVDKAQPVTHLSEWTSRVTLLGAMRAFLFVFKSVGRELSTTSHKFSFKEDDLRRNPAYSWYWPSVLSNAFWRVTSMLVLTLFYSISIAIQSRSASPSSLAEAVYYSWLGLPLLASMATFSLARRTVSLP